MRSMRPTIIATRLLVVGACAVPGFSTRAAQGRSRVQRDVEGYATASCLARQKDPVLKDQGSAWLDVIVQRSEGDIEEFKSVADAVEAQLAREPMPMARQERDPMHSKALPLLQCAEIIDDPTVRSAINKAIKKLTPAYRHARR